MKYKICLILILLLGSCKPQKTITEYKETIKVDTFIREQIKTIYEPINDTLWLPSPCDSLGNVIPVVFTNNIIRYRASKSGVSLIVNQKKRVDSSLVEKSKSQNTDVQIKYVEIIKEVIPLWIWITLIVLVLLVLFFIWV
jgi:hypothetical protein